MLFPDFTTGTGNGTVTMTFASGDTLFGNLHEQIDFSSPPDATAFTQIIDVTGGTGAFLSYTGKLTGSGTTNLATSTALWFQMTLMVLILHWLTETERVNKRSFTLRRQPAAQQHGADPPPRRTRAAAVRLADARQPPGILR